MSNPQKIMLHMHGIIPYMVFDYWADPVVHLLASAYLRKIVQKEKELTEEEDILLCLISSNDDDLHRIEFNYRRR